MGNQVELKNKDLLDNALFNSLKKIINFDSTNHVASYRASKLIGLVEGKSKSAEKELQLKVKGFEFVHTDPNDEKSPKVPKDIAAFEKMQEEFLETPVDVGNNFKIHINDLIGCKLNALDFHTLGGKILTGLEELEEKGEQDGKENIEKESH
jgi:hypothetical protein